MTCIARRGVFQKCFPILNQRPISMARKHYRKVQSVFEHADPVLPERGL